MKWVFANGDDWTGLYLDGRLIDQGHSFTPEWAARQAMITPPTDVEVREVDYKWLSNRGWLPDNLDEVEWYER